MKDLLEEFPAEFSWNLGGIPADFFRKILVDDLDKFLEDFRRELMDKHSEEFLVELIKFMELLSEEFLKKKNNKRR